MKASIIKIGNSKGIRIPKKFLEEANLKDIADIEVSKDGLIIRPAKTKVEPGMLLSRSALAKEWDTPEEDTAWAYLQ